MTPTGPTPEPPFDLTGWILCLMVLLAFGLTTGAMIGLSLQRLGVLP